MLVRQREHTTPRAWEREHTPSRAQERRLVAIISALDALTPATGLFNKKSKSWGVIGAMSAASPRAPTAGAGSSDAGRTVVAPSSRNELMLIDAELREAYTAATLMPDGRSRRGRKTKHNTATRRWIDTVGFPCVELGKRPPEADMAMLKLTPRSSLSGANLIARDAWSQLHGRDPRSKQQTAAEQAGQQTLLAWARTNLPLDPATVRRGRVSSWKLTFGRWKGYTPRQLALSSAAGGAALPTQQQGGQGGTPPGPYLLWFTGQHAFTGKPSRAKSASGSGGAE